MPNTVTIRVWLNTGGKVGHATLQTRNYGGHALRLEASEPTVLGSECPKDMENTDTLYLYRDKKDANTLKYIVHKRDGEPITGNIIQGENEGYLNEWAFNIFIRALQDLEKNPNQARGSHFFDENINEKAKSMLFAITEKRKHTGSGIYVSMYPRISVYNILDSAAYMTKPLVADIRKYKKAKEKYLQTRLGRISTLFSSSQDEPIEIKLNNLNVEEIEKEYKDFIDSGFKFAMLGSSIFKDPHTHNCTSLVFHLLQKGGIDKSISILTRLKVGARNWALVGRNVGIFAAPFSAFFNYHYVSRARQILYGTGHAALQGSFVAIHAGTGQNMYRLYRDYYDITNFAWLLASIDFSAGKLGYLICFTIMLTATSYVSFAGLGSSTNFAVITPADLAKITEEAKKIEDKIITEAPVARNEHLRSQNLDDSRQQAPQSAISLTVPTATAPSLQNLADSQTSLLTVNPSHSISLNPGSNPNSLFGANRDSTQSDNFITPPALSPSPPSINPALTK